MDVLQVLSDWYNIPDSGQDRGNGRLWCHDWTGTDILDLLS